MNQQVTNAQSIDRILVALDTSPASQAALQAAVELALDFKAEVLGLFVEDIHLLRLAEMSFTQEVGLFSATTRRLEIRYMERQFRGQANQARRALARLADQAGVDWSFRVVRGDITSELLTAASETELVILGKVGWSPLRRKRLGSTARAVLSQGPQLTLILQRGVSLGVPVLLVYNGSVVAQRALALTVQMMARQEDHLTVLILAEGRDTAQRLQNEVTAWLEEQNQAARYLWQTTTDARSLAGLVRWEGCRMLVLPRGGLLLEDEEISRLLDQIDCPLLVVR